MLPLAARGLAVLPRPRSAARAPSSSSSAAPAARPVAVRAAAKSSSPAGASSAAYDEDKDDDVIAGRRLAVTRMTVVQIKDELEKLGASTLGLRTDLAARLGAERAAQMHAKASPPAKVESLSTLLQHAMKAAEEAGAAGAAPGAAAPGVDDDANAVFVPTWTEEEEAERATAAALAAAAAPAFDPFAASSGPPPPPAPAPPAAAAAAAAPGDAAGEVSEAAAAEAAPIPAPPPPPAAPSGPSYPVRVRATVKVAFGDAVLLAGSHPALGGWDAAGAAQLAWSDGDVWASEEGALQLPAGVEAKFVVRHGDGAYTWQSGPNLELAAGPEASELAFEGISFE